MNDTSCYQYEIGLSCLKLVPSEVGGKSLIVTGQRDGHELQHLLHDQDLPFNFTVFLIRNLSVAFDTHILDSVYMS